MEASYNGAAMPMHRRAAAATPAFCFGSNRARVIARSKSDEAIQLCEAALDCFAATGNDRGALATTKRPGAVRFFVMPGHSRPKNGVAEFTIGPATSGRTRWLAYVPGIPLNWAMHCQKRIEMAGSSPAMTPWFVLAAGRAVAPPSPQ
jgi:hypothetical protein